MGTMHKILPAAALLAALLLRCGMAEAQPGPQPATVHMSYTGTAYGLSVLAVEAALATDATGYRVDVNFHTVGLLSMFVTAEFHSTTWGVWRGGRAEPERFWSWGHLRGAPRETLIDYRDGDPVLRRMVPANAAERDEVSPAERNHTVDTLTAIAFLLHRVADAGVCDGRERVFDGRRLSEIDAHTVGQVMTTGGMAGTYLGATLLCDFTGQQLAGFRHNGGDWQLQPHNGHAWLASPVPGGPPIPVRLVFDTRWVGGIVMTLTDAAAGPLPAAPR